MEIKHVNILVSGMVQGVGFRYSCQKIAKSLGVKGFVKNMYNGDVYIEVEGDEAQLNKMVKWCWQGPSNARVTEVSIDNGSVKNFKHFEIKS